MDIKLRLNTVLDVKQVCSIATSIPNQVETSVISGVYQVDAKSLMGIFSLDLSKPVTLRMTSEYEVNYEYYKSLFNRWTIE